MMWEPLPRRRILALDPSHRGIGFAVIDQEQLRLVDWGIKTCGASALELRLEKTLHLVDLYTPTHVVIEDWRRTRSLRRDALRPFSDPLELALHEKNVGFATYSREDVRRAFSLVNARTQEEIAALLASKFPELLWRLPPQRKTYMSEQYQMSIFDAVALGLTHIHVRSRGP